MSVYFIVRKLLLRIPVVGYVARWMAALIKLPMRLDRLNDRLTQLETAQRQHEDRLGQFGGPSNHLRGAGRSDPGRSPILGSNADRLDFATDLKEFDERFRHAMYTIGRRIPESVRTGRFLDIGCGMGGGVVAASCHGAALAVGIDKSFDVFKAKHNFRISEFPALCARAGGDCSRALLIEGDLFQFRFAPASFHWAMMLDTIEHIPNAAAFFEYACRCLGQGGYLLIDTEPLYFSSAGHHLSPFFPSAELPWVHLRRDFDELVSRAKIDAWHWSHFKELNKLTQDEIIGLVENSGFSIEYQHRDSPNEAQLALLEAHRPKLNLEGIAEAWLFEQKISILARKR